MEPSGVADHKLWRFSYIGPGNYLEAHGFNQDIKSPWECEETSVGAQKCSPRSPRPESTRIQDPWVCQETRGQA